MIKKIRENGQLNQIILEYSRQKPNCQPIKETGTPLSIHKLMFMFIIILSGMGLAILILAIENFVVCRKFRNKMILDSKAYYVNEPTRIEEMTQLASHIIYVDCMCRFQLMFIAI